MIRKAAIAFDRIRAPRFFALVVVVYCGLALASYWPSWPGDPSTLPSCACGDGVQQSWFLYWAPWALIHGHNPLFTSWINWPVGANLGQNTEMPLLGIITAPLSLTVGPVASFNLLMWLAYPLSALSMAFVVRRWTRSNSASLVAGLLYGFSQYVVGEGQGHLNLSFVPLPPLIVAAFVEILVRQPANRRWWGVGLGILMSAQFLISSEILATTCLVVLIGGVIAAVSRRRELTRVWFHSALEGLIPAAVITAAVLCYPIYFMLFGPEHYSVSIQGPTNPYRADLLAPFLPTSDVLLAPSRISAMSNQFTGATKAENGSYLGIPLILVSIFAVVRYRRIRWVPLSASLAVVAYILSLGPRLVVNRDLTSVPLPFALFTHLKLLDNILPSRFSLYSALFSSVVVAFAIASFVDAARPPSPPHPRRVGPSRERRWLMDGAIAVTIAAVTATLAPRWPIPSAPIDMPAFFSSSAINRIPSNSEVLTYPFAVSPFNHAMLWQTKVNMRFKLIGGYAINPGADEGVTAWPPLLPPDDVQEFLGWEEFNGPIGYILKSPPKIDSQLAKDTAAYISTYRVDTVIVDLTVAPNAQTVIGVFTKALGRPPEITGGVAIWFDLSSALANASA